MIKSFQLVAPAGKASDENLELATPSMKALGYELKKDYFSYKPLPYLAASDEERARSLSEAWSSGEAVICLRGGYGCTRLLDLLDWEQLRKTSNLLIGHSDISALHLAFLKHGLSRTISGIMAAAEFTRLPDQALTLSSFEHGVQQESFQYEWVPSFYSSINYKVSGKLIPVTLSVLCSMVGSQHLPDFSESILILEDINEVPYKVDRMLTQLKLANIPQLCAAIIMGDFNNCGSEQELNRIFIDFAKSTKAPIINGLPFGHCLPRLNLPVGAEVELNFHSTATLKIIRY
ncbi:LD-carboxypeptidase family protein [Lentisphaera araneosa HTCC2155]|uniref:LD-carboxypeptidase family protein n=1 Tax=Lentisphaera araneosa HTCC2155 TaxID=313628 RepID=A6DNT8_9BACT|nr:LD-carboxypeptidase [Lentisphaera araneosa]EDM26747.1 LD-carboxypeptidase family protein [Lentisphaera araneosa HTCC2155]